MAKRNAELLLYRGHCNADGVSEGRFRLDVTDRYSNKRYLQANQTVQKYLSAPYRDWAIQVSGVEGVVKSEKEAVEAISFAQHNIGGATGIVELLYSNHGRIVFDRKIRFEGWSRAQNATLIELLRQAEPLKRSYISDTTLAGNLACSNL